MFQQGLFNIGQDMTPEEIARNRQIIAQLMPSGRGAQYAGAGMVDLARGVAGGLANRAMNGAERKANTIAEGVAEFEAAGSPMHPKNEAPQGEPFSFFGGADPVALSGGGGADALAGNPGMDALDVPGSPMGFPNAQTGVAPNVPSGLRQRGASLQAGRMDQMPRQPQAPMSADALGAAQAMGGFRNEPSAPQGGIAPPPDDQFDYDLMMDAGAPGMFEREMRGNPSGPKVEPVQGGREYRQNLHTGQGVADLGMNTTEGQVTGYALRAQEAEQTLQQFEDQGTNFWSRAASILPGNTENMILSADYQQYLNAEQNFLAAVLRRDTGAAITSEEFSLYRPMFFPQPGDSPEVMEQKRRMREQALLGLRAGAGEGIAVLPNMGAASPSGPAAPAPQPAQPQPTHRFNPATGQIEAIQ